MVIFHTMAGDQQGKAEKQLGNGTKLRVEARRVVLRAAADDVIVITQTRDQLKLIVNGREDVTLTAEESAGLEIQGNPGNIFADRSVKLAIKGLAKPVMKPSSQAGQRLAKARQRSSAFGAALAQQRIAADFQKDPFLTRMADQLQKLASLFGVSLYRLGSPATAADLVPLLKETARTLEFQLLAHPLADASPVEPGREGLDELSRGLCLSITNTIEDMRRGAELGLDALASQLAELLTRLPAPPPKVGQEKNSVARLHRFEPGEDMRRFYGKIDEIERALGSEDMDAVMNGDAIEAALTEEKAALLAKTCSVWRRTGDPRKCASAALRILSTVAGPAELELLMKSAGRENAGSLFQAEDGLLTDLNVVLGALSCVPPFADAAGAQIARDALAAGFSPRQIIGARQRMRALLLEGKREDLEAAAESVLHLMVCTVADRESLLKRLVEGKTSVAGSRALLSVLESAADASQFDRLVAASGDILVRVTDPASRRRLSRLAAGYDRMQWAPDAESARSCQRVLLSNAAATQPPKPDVAGVPADPAQIAARLLQSRLSYIDRGAHVLSVLAGTELRKQGKAALNPAELRLAAHEILMGSSTPEKQRKSRLQELAGQHGLAEEDAGNILLPVAHTYTESVEEFLRLSSPLTGRLAERARRLRLRLGRENSQALGASAELAAAESQVESVKFRMQQASRMLRETYAAAPTGGLRKGSLGRS